MPANLPPQYYELEREFKAEKDPREKLRLGQELLAMMPKHKGTDKLQADLKAKISKLKKQVDGGGETKHGARQAKTFDHIEREGAGQIILIGAPNSGKSSLVDVLTHAQPLVADYPYSTREPLTGMMPFETIQIQLIDTPPISHELYENYLSNLIRLADTVVIVADLGSAKMIDDLKFILETLEAKRIILKAEVKGKPDDPRYAYKRTIICAHKEYEDEDSAKRKLLQDLFPGFRMVATSILDDKSLDEFKKAVYDSLSIMRVFTKRVGAEPDFNDPIILHLGGTVEEAANVLHKDFARKLKFARVWGEGKFEGQRVHNDFVLSDKDILEFHI
jgi:ribosome-interacting GTPase 1